MNFEKKGQKMDYFSAKEMLVIGIVLGVSLAATFAVFVDDIKHKF